MITMRRDAHLPLLGCNTLRLERISPKGWGRVGLADFK